MLQKMMQKTYFSISILTAAFLLYSAQAVACPAKPVGEFDEQSSQGVQQAFHTLIGKRDETCIYFRDLTFKNGQGQQSIVVSSERGHCKGFFRLPLAVRADLIGDQLRIVLDDKTDYLISLKRGIPSSIFFDGEVVYLEKCSGAQGTT